jgi:hypothetical protein
MRSSNSLHPPRISALVLLVAATLGTCGCEPRNNCVNADSPELARFIEVVMPARLKILSWTKPVSLAGDGNADAIEVIVAAYDSFDDVAKVVGQFQFELKTRRLSDRIGTRIAFWPVEIDTAKSMRSYLVHPSGFYRFPLELPERPLPPGRYALSVQLQLPTGQRLFDEYEFDYDGSGAPTVRDM